MSLVAPFFRPFYRSSALALLGLLSLTQHPSEGQSRLSPQAGDSLRRLLATPQPDTVRVATLLAVTDPRLTPDSVQARRYLVEAAQLAQKAGYDFGRARAYLRLSYLASIRNDLGQDSLLLQRAKRLLAALYRRRPEPRIAQMLGRIAINVSSLQQRRNNLSGSIKTLLEAIPYLKQLDDNLGLVVVYYNIGSTFSMLGQPEQALRYWREGLALAPKVHNASYLTALASNVARHYVNQGDSSRARPYLRQARQMAFSEANSYYLDLYLSVQGQFYTRFGEPQRGLPLLLQALPLARRRGDLNLLGTLLRDLGEAYADLGQYAQARPHLLESLQLLQEDGDPQQRIQTLELLGNVEKKAGQPALALRYYERRTALRDSLSDVAVRAQINGLEARYQARQREQQIRLLRQSQRLQAAELRRQRQLSYAALALALALLGVGGLSYVAIRNRRRLELQQQQLQAQKIQELEQERQLTATEALLRGQEEERGRLARDLHDGLGGMLSSVKYYLGSIRGAVVLPEASAVLFARSLSQLDSSISELRRVARDMMPEALLQLGLVPALRDVCEAVQHSQQLPVQFQAYGFEQRLPQRTEVVVYRLIQELLNNIQKHAQARHVVVQLMRSDQHVQVIVEDDGQGFDANAASTGVGLRSIRARADYLKGTLDLRTAPGQGTTFTLDFDLPVEERGF